MNGRTEPEHLDRRFDEVTLHHGVELTHSRASTRILDPSTGTDVVVSHVDLRCAEEDVMRILLANGLGRAPRPVCRMLAESGQLDRRTRSDIIAFGTAHRVLAPDIEPEVVAGLRLARSVTTLMIVSALGLLRAFGSASALLAGLLAVAFLLVHVPIGTTLWASASPFLVLVNVALHESAHWAALRIVDGCDGALLVGRGCCAIMHRPLRGWRDRVVAAAGPLIGFLGALGGALIALPDLVGTSVAVILALVNLVGLTPWSADGARLLEPGRRVTTKEAAVDDP